MIFEPLKPDGLFLLKPKIFGDNRGYFLETFRREYFKEHGIDTEFVQDNYSFSRKNALRGLHYQAGDSAQAKLITVAHGSILDVAVDLRKESPSFKEYAAVELNSENHHQLFIPEGFAHGFVVLSEEAAVMYKCSSYYDPEAERGIRWNDPELNIQWETEIPVLSEKDRELPLLKEISERDLF